MLQGTLDLMVLQTVDTLGPLHGYAIAARLEQVSGGALQLNMGTLYPALMRLEQRGLLRGTWGTTDSQPQGAVLRLTAAGRRQLAREAGLGPDGGHHPYAKKKKGRTRGQKKRGKKERKSSARHHSILSAAEVRHVPLGDTGTTVNMQRGGRHRTTGMVRANAMTPGYLTTMGMRLIAGRDFETRDSSSSAKVAIVNGSFVRQLGLSGNVVGQRFRTETSLSSSRIVEIIGLVPDSKCSTLREPPLPIVFVPMAQITDPRRSPRDGQFPGALE